MIRFIGMLFKHHTTPAAAGANRAAVESPDGVSAPLPTPSGVLHAQDLFPQFRSK